MHTRLARKPRVSVLTLGCAKNLVDSERLVAHLNHAGIPAIHANGKLTPIVIVNTCGFIDRAKLESIEVIDECIHLKKQGQIEKLYVFGCLVSRYPKELEEAFPEVDGFFPTEAYASVLQSLVPDYRFDLVGERCLGTPRHYAYLKISEGCNRKCSFCAIPLIRGKHRSVPIEKLVEEATALAQQGVKELILIAQDLSYYGIELYGKRKLRDLVEELALIDGIEWIRLHYLYPAGFPMEILDQMRQNPKICHYIDIPFQHVSDRILTRMRRGTKKKHLVELIDRIRSLIPDIAIRSTFIVGFPGETEEDFEELLAFLETYRLDRVGVFAYSHEEQTHAFEHYQDEVPEEVKQERIERLMTLQQMISLQKNREKVGKQYRVLIDREANGMYYGRTQYDSPEVDNEVILTAELQVGQFYNVLITDALEYDLIGQVVA
jgi:ribosomal protein S12 methylthiotransferase